MHVHPPIIYQQLKKKSRAVKTEITGTVPTILNLLPPLPFLLLLRIILFSLTLRLLFAALKTSPGGCPDV